MVLFHTDNTNDILNIIDTGGAFNSIENRIGVGPDGLFGTSDDIRVDFLVERFEPTQGNFGTQFVPQALAHVLSVGGVGTTSAGTILGTVFNDQGAPGVFTGDVGLAGITVFLEVDGLPGLTAGDLSGVTDAAGVYRIAAPAGSYTLFAQIPNGTFASTPIAVPVNVNASGVTPGPSFGIVAPGRWTDRMSSVANLSTSICPAR